MRRVCRRMSIFGMANVLSLTALVSHGHGASPSVRSNARLSVALRDRPGHAGSREEGSIWKSTWPKTLTGCNEQISHAFFP